MHITGRKTQLRINNLHTFLTTKIEDKVEFRTRNISAKLTAYILTYGADTSGNSDNTVSECPTCDKEYDTKLGRTQHQRQPADCKIMYAPGKLCLKMPN